MEPLLSEGGVRDAQDCAGAVGLQVDIRGCREERGLELMADVYSSLHRLGIRMFIVYS